MKQKYTITIGDVQMNVISEESPESVEKVVGHVDRKIREINLKSSRCSKHEAALLCALDYCTEKLSLQGKLNELEEQNDKLFRALERLQRENEKLGESLDLERARGAQLTLELQTAQTAAARAQAQAQVAAAAAIAAAEGNATVVSDTVPPVVAAPKPADTKNVTPTVAPTVSATTVPMAVHAPVAPAPAAPAAPVEEKPAVVTGIPSDEPVAAPAAPVAPAAPAASAPAAAPASEPTPAPTPAPAAAKPSVGTATPVDHIVQKKKTYSYRSSAAARAKNKVGNMFETLTFHDDE